MSYTCGRGFSISAQTVQNLDMVWAIGAAIEKPHPSSSPPEPRSSLLAADFFWRGRPNKDDEQGFITFSRMGKTPVSGSFLVATMYSSTDFGYCSWWSIYNKAGSTYVPLCITLSSHFAAALLMISSLFLKGFTIMHMRGSKVAL